jgi:hypothetical protein
MNGDILLSSALLLTLLTIRAASSMNSRTAPGIRTGILLMCIGSASVIATKLFPTFSCQEELYNWLIPAGAAIYLLSDRRTHGARVPR